MKKEKSKNHGNKPNGPRGCKSKQVVQKERTFQAQLRTCLLQPLNLYEHSNTRFLSPNSWTFKQNSQHEKCRA